MVDFKSILNKSQYDAVTAIYGPVLVIAGAGSGKTRVIEYRVLNLVQNSINPASILLLTFTRAASQKMLERSAKHDGRCRYVEGGTFHSFAYKILRRYGRRIGLPEIFSILDEGDAIEALGQCIAASGMFAKEKRGPKKDTLKSILSASVNKGIAIEKILLKEYPDFLVYKEEIVDLKDKYAGFKRQRNFLDYDDLLVFAKLLFEDEKIRESLSERYPFIMVDEYQDTNKLQAGMVYSLAGEQCNVMAVGDDAQSIYGFRGASHENIMEFPKRFSQCRIIKLEENYRSTQSILDLANSALANMENKYSKCLVSARNNFGTKPEIIFFENAYQEAEWITEQIIGLKKRGVCLNNQAALFRSSYISIPLQTELSKNDISYQVFGGLKFYETGHVKDVMAHLKVLTNPKDEISWRRVLMLLDGIGPKTADKILKGIDPVSPFNLSFPYKGEPELKRLQSVLQGLRSNNRDIRVQFEAVIDYYTPLLKDKFDDWRNRLSDLEVLKQIAGKYDSLPELLADFAVEIPESGRSAVDPAVSGSGAVTLSTIHSAKGLEWDCVFVLGLMEGVFPVSFSLDDDDQIEEEHRLFYVAVTRAKNNLFLSLHHESNRFGALEFNRASRFIDAKNILSKVKLGGISREAF